MSYKILSDIHSGIPLFSESWATQGLGMDDEDDGVPKQSKVGSHVEEILSHMARHVKGDQKQPLLFTGAPGIGKTTLIETFSKLVGLPYVVIEVPHIVEEHLINIPFIVSDPISDTRKSLNDTEIGKSQTGQTLVLADSVLWTELNKKAKTKLDDSQYLSYMYSNKMPQYILQMFEEMGGSEHIVPPQIRKVRNMYHAILFIDEYMRVTSKRIRNIMRGFLDRRLGLHSLPESLYVTFASNTRTSSPTESSRSLDTLDANQEFKFIEFEPPTKDEWFGWFKSKHTDVDPELLRHFQEKLTDADISFDDVETSVRTSPRRWENLLLFIDKAIKHPNLNVDLPHMIATIRNNFIVYDHSGNNDDTRPTHSPHADKVIEAVTEFLKEERNMHIGGTGSHAVEWRDTLKHYMQVQMDSPKRKYIPVLSGLPGIGKTTSLLSLEANLNVVVVDVNVSTFDAEEAMGIPTATERTKDEDNNEKISVGFSKPVLFQMMMNKLQEKTKMFKERLNSSPEGQEKLKQWQHQNVKYVVLFDELNRVNDKTFNVLRKVMLEKEFGHDESGKVLKMPEGTLFVGAINPTGATTSPLTQHFRDVIDIIPVAPSWSSTVDYVTKAINQRDDVSESVSRTIVPMITSFVDHFSEDSKAERHKEEYRFHLKFGADDVYVSPRMIAGLADSVAGRLQRVYDKFTRMEDAIPSAQVRSRHFKAAIVEEIDRFVLAARAEQHGMDLEALRSDLLKWVNASFEEYGAILLQHVADVDPHLTQEMEIKSLVNMFLSSNKTQFEQQMIKGITDNPTIVHLLEEDPERIRKDLVDGFIESFEQAVSGGGISEAAEWLRRMYMPNQKYFNHMNEEGISVKEMHSLHDWNAQPQVSNAKLKFDPTEKMSMIEYIFSVVLHIAHELNKGKETIDTILSAFKSLTFVDGELHPIIKKYVDVEAIEQKNSNELTDAEAEFAKIYEYVFQGKAANYHKHNRLHNYRLNQRQQK